MEISVSKGTQNYKPIEVSNFEELAKIITSTNYSLGTFKNNDRTKASFIQASAIGLDFDGEINGKRFDYTIEQAEKDFKPYKHIIAPSRSHRKEKNGLVADRFRVILLLEKPITDLETFEATWQSLKAKFPAADPKCKDPSRFWYPSNYVSAINKKGKRVPVVTPTEKPKEKPKASLDVKLKGRLSKDTYRFLREGEQAGSRNHTTFKAAKEFQQNLYSLDEALTTIVSALEATGTIAPDFTREEIETTIRSAYKTDPKYEPRIQEKAFKLQRLGELYRTTKELDWLVARLLTVGGVSLMSSDPKAGKSTLVRQLIRDVIRGTDFLGRKCKQGSVHYYAIEEQLEVINTSFRRLGLDGSEDLFIHIGDPLTDNTFEDFREILLETKPALAVIDTLFDFLDVESENSYKEVKRELRKLRRVARESGTHILLVHHNSKAQKDDKRRGNRGILGSQAIAGGVDTIMVLEVDGKDRLITSSGREIRPWFNRELVYNDEDCTYALGPEYDLGEF